MQVFFFRILMHVGMKITYANGTTGLIKRCVKETGWPITCPSDRLRVFNINFYLVQKKSKCFSFKFGNYLSPQSKAHLKVINLVLDSHDRSALLKLYVKCSTSLSNNCNYFCRFKNIYQDQKKQEHSKKVLLKHSHV